VPDNVPNKDMLAAHLGKPLTQVPDPFGTHPSFGAHNNARLRAFLDTFGFDYEFMSSTDCYKSGRFDAALLTMLARFDAVMTIMLPSLREERAQTYSPFLPISPRTGIVLQVPIVEHDAKAGTITYEDPDTKERVTTPVTGGTLQAAMEARLGDALGRARHRLRDGRQGPDRLGQAVGRDRARARRAAARKASTTSSSSTRRGRRSPSRRATASPSRNGCATPARSRCRCSCIRTRGRRSGSIST
jgi:hypothetical protein